MGCWNLYFYSVFLVCAFLAKLSKKGNFRHPPKKKKLTDNWKALFWVFLCFFVFFCFFVCFLFIVFVSFTFFLFFLFGGFKGQVRWPEGPPHLALNPPYFFFVFVLSFCLEGFKGQVRWPEGPPHLALNPPYFFFVLLLLFFSFPFFASNRQTNPVSPPLEKGHFLFIFERLPLFLLSLFWGLRLFNSSFSVSLWLFSLFFPCCLSFLLSFCSFFFSLSFHFFFFAFISWKEQHQNI